ncbi:PX domain-containing protein [Colletotrichum paranaense]|uniref:Sorting nexin-4 n=7 Tax=Colletotrichum acutatum species complex TaxID=2707335 RepID=A0A9Q8T364_9PEZI|nr:PX domain-containing protein [Colletotrichum lupini]XP_060314839.1 PX domain-containing protein [Colletotrichum costaricense]XP_060356268.1 PX domain-containing protein [Colletotrichum paranaense]XP_060388099.1 PX domain-containing protein [Colletotrichum tamarilloi]KAI3537433.1 PX domain-containing protein [Colletotrichum filicis]KAK0380406.1 PX domain-containing protein [Colletotrichum limetticola]KAK1455372.1 PX domain-containing protein [Colletotrichum melonis]KAK1480731.1 PX domain-c
MAVMDQHQDDFSNVSWNTDEHTAAESSSSVTATEYDEDADRNGHHAYESDAPGNDDDREVLDCTVSEPLKENEGSKDTFVSYLITTNTTFPSFQRSHTTARRRFTDFVFLYKALSRDYPTAAVPPLPDKQRMEYVSGNRFGPDFTNRRAHSLQRFLNRLSLHPVLRRADILHIFLESPDWNATMRSRSLRGSQSSDAGSSGVFDNLTDSFLNAFSKAHKHDKRFLEVRERSDKLDEDLAHIEKVVARVARRENDLELDFKDLAEQFQKLITLEPGVESEVRHFANSIEDTAMGLRKLKDVTDGDYLGSLRDMQAYSTALKSLLKAREQKQVDYEQLTEYLNKNTVDRDQLQSGHGSGGLSGASGRLMRKLEDVRGVDHEQARRDRQRKLEMNIDKLTTEAERAKKTSEMFDDEVVKEVADFERIKRVEFKKQLGGLADSHIEFYDEVTEIWESYVKAMEEQGVSGTRSTGVEPPGRRLAE